MFKKTKKKCHVPFNANLDMSLYIFFLFIMPIYLSACPQMGIKIFEMFMILSNVPVAQW